MQHECCGFLISSVGTFRLNLSTRSQIKVVRNAVTPVRLDRILCRGLRDLAVSGLRERQSLYEPAVVAKVRPARPVL